MSIPWKRAACGWALCLISAMVGPRPTPSESGPLDGVREHGLSVYKGVPYAAPPLGDLRWREPQRAARWEGVHRADTFAPACLQKGASMPGETPPATREDCLYLNIWSPARRSRERLPVLAWIHGGAYANGSASMPP